MSSRQTPRHRAAARRRLPRVALGAAAVAVAVVLLTGGPGSVASWTGTANNHTGTFRTGSLTMAAPTCSWQLTQTGGTVSQVPSPNPTPYTGQLLQPNDVVTGTCTVAVHASADHFQGHVEVAVATAPVAPLQQVGTPTISSSDTSDSHITQATTSVTVTIRLTIPSTDTSNPAADAPNVWNANVVSIRAVQDRPS